MAETWITDRDVQVARQLQALAKEVCLGATVELRIVAPEARIIELDILHPSMVSTTIERLVRNRVLQPVLVREEESTYSLHMDRLGGIAVLPVRALEQELLDRSSQAARTVAELEREQAELNRELHELSGRIEANRTALLAARAERASIDEQVLSFDESSMAGRPGALKRMG